MESVRPVWVPDHHVQHCQLCDVGFNVFRRRHHCRNCGHVFCDRCSSKRWASKAGKDVQVRVCDTCFEELRKRSLAGKLQGRCRDDSPPEKVLYETKTLCVHCSIIERKGFEYVPGEVIEKNSQVWLNSICSSHGKTSTLYCSSAAFFRRVLSFEEDETAITSDIEDIASQVRQDPGRESLPLIMELEVYRGSSFVSISAIDSQVRRFQALYAPDSNFILNIKGGILRDTSHLAQLNSIVLHIERTARKFMILLDMSFERLIDLSRLPNSCLLKGRVFPCVRYFLTAGMEKVCVDELSQLVTDLRDFSSIQLTLAVCFERPFPDFSLLLDFFEANRSLIRFLILSRERSPRGLLARISSQNADTPQLPESVDPLELIDAVSRGSSGRIQRDDFVPISAAQCLEPFLRATGYGAYNLRASSFCGFVAGLMHSDSSAGKPLTRLVDVPKLFRQLKQVNISTESLSDVMMARRLKQIVDSCSRNGSPLPSPDQLLKYGQNTQFIVIHNTMDFASLDLRRRCRCALLTTSAVSPNDMAASCSGGCF